jgi:asparagine synthase (glutamine-hydrolysing)
MSAVLGIFGVHRHLPDDGVVREMVGRMSARGADRVAIWRGNGAVMAVARHDWELAGRFSGQALVVEDGPLVVAADASLYYRDDLRRRLAAAGMRPAGETPSHLILAAHRAWGVEGINALEGDFAYIVFDRDAQSVVCARDFAGRRPLFYLEESGVLVVGSTISGVKSFPGHREAINLAAVGATAAGLLGASRETVFRGVFALPAGHHLRRTPLSGARVERHWEPPIFESGSKLSFDEAGEALRELLVRATGERISDHGPTTVWMSGGWDSTAVFGAGQTALRARGSAENLDVVSISYPPGDPGREDEIIGAIARHWNCPVRWLHIDDIPFFEGMVERASLRDEPMAHVYDTWNRALIGATARGGSHVAFDGMGGDGLFQVSTIFMADLLRTGRWGTMVREWRAKQLPFTAARFFKAAIQPLLPEPVLGLVAAMRGGRPLRGHLERAIPEWIDERFAAQNGLAELARSPVRRRRGESAAARETQWHLLTPWVPAILSYTSSVAVEQGVEVRSPLYDRRVIEFAATRPREERSSMRETKRLLRRSMQGVLPDEVLAPRTHRTGMTTGYFDRSMKAGLRQILSDAFLSSPSVLVESGVINMDRFGRAVTYYLRRGDREVGLRLLLTLQAELWLRARTGRPLAVPGRELPVGVAPATAAVS